MECPGVTLSQGESFHPFFVCIVHRYVSSLSLSLCVCVSVCRVWPFCLQERLGLLVLNGMILLPGLCQDCGEFCKTCDAINDCKVCQAGFVSIEGQCLSSREKGRLKKNEKDR